MKKILALAVLIALVGTLTFGVAGCGKGEETEETAVEKKVEETAAQYACSMKCEGEKTYSDPGNCPVCGGALKKVE